MEKVGIILAGGAGTRLWPATLSVSKQLLPIYDKPMIFYPLTTLMEAGIRTVLIISQASNIPLYSHMFGANVFGMDIQYAAQNEPKGIAEALPIASDFGLFEQDTKVIALILGDNLFCGQGFVRGVRDEMLRQIVSVNHGRSRASVFLSRVKNPEAYGVALFDGDRITGIEEKPQDPQTDWAVAGLYLYSPDAVARARELEPSSRGELEITDLNATYLLRGRLFCRRLREGDIWFDTGTPEALLQASQYVQAVQDRSGVLIGSPERAAFSKGWITAPHLRRLADNYPNAYGKALRHLSYE